MPLPDFAWFCAFEEAWRTRREEEGRDEELESGEEESESGDEESESCEEESGSGEEDGRSEDGDSWAGGDDVLGGACISDEGSAGYESEEETLAELRAIKGKK